MKKMNILGVLTASLLAVISTQATFGQKGNKVEIVNFSREERKICFHRVERDRRHGTETVKVFPLGCYRLQSKQRVTWNRTDKEDLHVKLYKPQLIDKVLGMRRMPGHTRYVSIEGSRGDVEFSDDVAGGTRYILKVCNKQYTQPILLALGFRTIRITATEGWWSVKKGSCVEFPISSMLFETWQVEYGTLPRLFYYARTKGNKPLVWRGKPGGHDGCVTESLPFTTNQFAPNSAGTVQAYACSGPQERKVNLRSIPAPKAGNSYFYLTF